MNVNSLLLDDGVSGSGVRISKNSWVVDISTRLKRFLYLINVDYLQNFISKEDAHNMQL